MKPDQIIKSNKYAKLYSKAKTQCRQLNISEGIVCIYSVTGMSYYF